MCGKPIDVTGATTDENGQVMREECYLKRVGQERTPPDDHHKE